ncbi:reverse transcriptase domain-containing protein [Tanacetum coccineum]
MRTRNSNFPNNSNVTIPRRRNRGRAPNIVEPELRTIVEVAPMAERTMEELLRAPTEGYGEAIVLPEINADHFEIKTNLLQLVQANPFHGYERENPHAHINSFKRITSTLRFRDVPNDVIKLMMFPYSLEGAAKVWYEKEPPNSILTWEDLVTKFVNQFFPPSKTTHLKNEISRFTQKFEETFSEAWERFKEMLRACPHHGFETSNLKLIPSITVLNRTIKNSKCRRRKKTNSRKVVSKTDERIDKLADQLSTLVEIVSKKVVTPAPVKAVEELCVTCSGPHAWYNCPNTDNNQASVCAATGSYNQVNPQNRVSNQMAPPGFAPVQNNGQNRYNQNQGQGNNFNRGNNFHGNQGFQAQNNHALNFQNQGFQNQPFQVPNNQVQQEFSNEFSSYKRTNDQMMRNMQNQINSLKGEVKNEIQNMMKTQQAVLMNQQNVFQTNLQNMLSGFFQNQASTSGTLPSNTIPNPKGEMKAITTRSDHILWDIITNGNQTTTDPASPSVSAPKTSLAANTRRNNEKALNILLSAILDRHLLSFYDAVDARTLWKAIKARFGGNDASKKMQKNPSKFEVSMKLPSVWHVVATNDSRQPGLMSFDFDDLYNNLKVYEHELKGVSINSPNIAFSVHRSQGKEKAYKAVPPPTGTIIPPRANVSFTGIDELAIRNKVVNQEKTKSSQPEIDRNKVIIEDWVDSDDEETDVSESQKETAFNSENSETSFENRMDNRRPRISSYSPSSRSSNPRTTYRPQRPKKIVKSIWVKKGSTVGSQAVLPQTISVKKSAMITSKQTWRQKGNYLDSVNRDNGSYTLKQFEATRRRLKDYAIIDSGWLWEHNVLFTDKECLILSPKFKFVDEDLVILRAPRKNDVYSLDLKNIIPSEDNYSLPSKTFKIDHSCLACNKGKQHRASCKKVKERTIREPLELLHMDLFGPVSVESINKKKYCLVVTDDCSKFSWVFFLAYKDETYDMLHDLIVGLENRLRHKVKTIRCDNGTEFKNQLMNEFCAKKGIKREYSIARTPQQNGVAERKNRTLIEAC